MYLLSFLEDERETYVGIFETMDDLQAFVQKIPGYKRMEEYFEGSVFVYETFDPKQLPDYMELSHNGHLIPLTRFMFKDQEEITILWREMTNLEKAGNGLVDGATIVDAYSVNNDEVEDYIFSREENCKRVSQILEKKGYEVERAFQGSEDGEALLIRKNGTTDWRFFMHMDPFFVSELPKQEDALEVWLEEELQEYQ